MLFDMPEQMIVLEFSVLTFGVNVHTCKRRIRLGIFKHSLLLISDGNYFCLLVWRGAGYSGLPLFEVVLLMANLHCKL